jgi:predicted anti-sigma-YlaC factor YlaD
MIIDQEVLKKLLQVITTTHTRELDCEECFDQLDCYAEMALAGKSVSEALPLVKSHLETCSACREEYEALLAALQALE